MRLCINSVERTIGTKKNSTPLITWNMVINILAKKKSHSIVACSIRPCSSARAYRVSHFLEWTGAPSTVCWAKESAIIRWLTARHEQNLNSFVCRWSSYQRHHRPFTANITNEWRTPHNKNYRAATTNLTPRTFYSHITRMSHTEHCPRAMRTLHPHLLSFPPLRQRVFFSLAAVFISRQPLQMVRLACTRI